MSGILELDLLWNCAQHLRPPEQGLANHAQRRPGSGPPSASLKVCGALPVCLHTGSGRVPSARAELSSCDGDRTAPRA